MQTREFRLSFYVGGFMGPFGATVILPMFPELRDGFNVSSQTIGWGFTAYLLPFALLLLVSGTLGERWGRQRTVRATYLLYTLASVLCAVSPNITMFLFARSLQGVATAFITPLLLSGLAEMVPPERFGRQVGIYSSFQALGVGLAPIVGGIAADTLWEAAFSNCMRTHSMYEWHVAASSTSICLTSGEGGPDWILQDSLRTW